MEPLPLSGDGLGTEYVFEYVLMIKYIHGDVYLYSRMEQERNEGRREVSVWSTS